LTFDVNLISKIKVEASYRKGLALNRDYRQADIIVYSNVPFTAHIDNLNEDDKGYELIKYRVNKNDEDKTNENKYTVSISIPKEITHDFRS
jgi:hypothetical protein